MKRKKLIAMLCALCICCAGTGSISGIRTVPPDGWIVYAEDTDLGDAEVTVNTEAKTVTVTLDDEPVPDTVYALEFFTPDDVLIGSSFPENYGSYYVHAKAIDGSGYSGVTEDVDFEYIDPDVDVVDKEFTGVNNNSPQNWDNTTDHATYSGFTAKKNNSIKLMLNPETKCGIIAAAKDADTIASTIEATWNAASHSTAKLLIYGKDTPYDSVDDLYNADPSVRGTQIIDIDAQNLKRELLDNGKYYKYIGIRPENGTVVLDDIRLTWHGEDALIDFDTLTPIVDKEHKTVGLKDENTSTMIPREWYDLKYINGHDSSELNDFPVNAGAYYAVFTANETAEAEGYTGELKCKFDIDPSYMVTIPASVELGNTMEIKAENVILNANGFQSLFVSLTSETDPAANNKYILKDGDLFVDYSILNVVGETETPIENGAKFMTVPFKDGGNTGSAALKFQLDEATLQYAGSYKGVVTFNIKIE